MIRTRLGGLAFFARAGEADTTTANIAATTASRTILGRDTGETSLIDNFVTSPAPSYLIYLAQVNGGGFGASVASVSRMDTFTIGDDLVVHRLGFGAMRITGDGIWGP